MSIICVYIKKLNTVLNINNVESKLSLLYTLYVQIMNYFKNCTKLIGTVLESFFVTEGSLVRASLEALCCV